MIETLIITIREGLESVLILFAMISTVRAKQAPHLQKPIWFGTLVALALGLSSVFFLPTILSVLHLNEEAYEGFLYLTGALFIFTLWIWLLRHKGWAGEARARVEKIVQSKWRALAIGSVAFLLIFREAFETLLFMGAISFSTSWLSQLIGFLLGLTIVLIFGIFFFRGHRWLPIQQIFRLSQVLLLILIIQFTVTGLHELIEGGILPGGPREMAIIGPLVNHDFLFFSVLLLGAMVWMIFRSRPSRPSFLESGNGPNTPSARKRLERALKKKLRRWRFGLVLMILISVGLMMGFYVATRPPATTPAEVLVPSGDVVRIPLKNLPEDTLVFYEIDLGDTNVRVFLLRHRGKVFTLLDACLLCGLKGYYQKGKTVYCRHCSAPITLDTIGVPGGCNPIPLPHTLETGYAIVKVSELKKILETDLPD